MTETGSEYTGTGAPGLSRPLAARANEDPGPPRPPRTPRASLLVLALSAFAAVTTEMLPVGLLPQISRSFGVGESTAGLLVTLYAVMVAVLAVPLTVGTRRFPRKYLLLVAVGLYAVSNLVAALSPSFAVLAAGRVVGGATHALFFSVCIGYAARLVPPDQTGRALALAQGGVSAGFVLGVPLATALGNATGWRTSFGVLVGLVVVVMVLIAVVLPDVRTESEEHEPMPGRRGLMATVIASNTLAFLGHYTLYTYVSVLLLLAGASDGLVGPILLGFGAVGLAGLWIAAPHLDHRPRTGTLVILALLCVAIAGVGAGYPVLWAVVAVGAVWTGAFGPVATLYQAAAVRTRATSPELAGAWINATCNVGIAAGAALGGAVLEAAGIRQVAWLAAALVAVALVVVVISRRAFPSTAAPLGGPTPGGS